MKNNKKIFTQKILLKNNKYLKSVIDSSLQYSRAIHFDRIFQSSWAL